MAVAADEYVCDSIIRSEDPKRLNVAPEHEDRSEERTEMAERGSIRKIARVLDLAPGDAAGLPVANPVLSLDRGHDIIAC